MAVIKASLLFSFFLVAATRADPLTQVIANSVTQADKSKVYRLPGNVQPESYTIKLTANLADDGDFPFEGDVFIELQVLNATDTLILHSRGLTIEHGNLVYNQTVNPGSPVGEKPNKPGGDKPTNPGGEKPTNPAGEKPTNPGGDKPTNPGSDKPTNPAGEKPTDPGNDKPTKPGGEKPTDREDEKSINTEGSSGDGTIDKKGIKEDGSGNQNRRKRSVLDILTPQTINTLVQRTLYDESSATTEVEVNFDTFTVDDEKLDTDFLTLKYKENLQKDTTYRLHLKFKGKAADAAEGFYKSSYINNAGTKEFLVSTHFEPTYARRAFPCFDEPALKAKYTLTITHPSDYTAISNTPVQEKKVNDKLTTTSFEQTPKMSSYLLAYAITKYGSVPEPISNFTVYTRKNALNSAKHAQKVGKQILRNLEEYTGIVYELKKLDQISIPNLKAGAMENWGLVTYRESALLYEDDSKTTTEQSVNSIIAHEFAHQWFGNLVSPDWWDYTWLNEGFATYFQYYIIDRLEPKWRFMEQFVTHRLQRDAFVADANKDAQCMNQHVESPSAIWKKFDSISYAKAGSVIRMIAHVLGEENFKKGLHSYLTALTYKSATPKDLYKHLQEAIDGAKGFPDDFNVETFATGWADEAGYPVISVKRNSKKTTTIEITQKPYSKDENVTTKWWVPINMVKGSAPDFSKTQASDWLRPTTVSLDISDVPENEWIILNPQQTGYYRVKYDDANYDLLRVYLSTENYGKIHPVNRAQLIDDLFHLAHIGMGNYSQALEFATYLSNEDDYIPWSAAFSGLKHLDQLLANSPHYEIFQAFNVILLQKLLHTLGFEETAQADAHLENIARAEAYKWACYYGSKRCIDDAKLKLANWLEDSANYPIPANLKEAVLCAGLRDGDQELWNKVFSAYKTATIETERSLLLKVLGCARSEDILINYLNMTRTTQTDIKNLPEAVQSVYNGSPKGPLIALNYITQYYDSLIPLHLPYMKNYIKDIAKKITTTEDFGKLMILVNTHNIEDSTIKESQTVAVGNIAFLNSHEPDIHNWLVKKNYVFPDESASKTPNSATSLSIISSLLFIIPLLLVGLY